MSNPLYYLFALILAMAYPTGAEPLRFARSGWASWIATFGALLITALLSAVFSRRIQSPRALFLGRGILKILAFGLFGVLIYGFHFPLFVWRDLRLEDVPLLVDLAGLAPFVAMLGIQAIFFTRTEARLRADGSTHRGLLSFAFRTFLGLSLFPVFCMLSLHAFLTTWMPMVKWTTLYPFAAWIAALTLITLLLLAAPLYLRLVFRARPLPAGPGRTRLEALAARAGFRCRELLLLDTGGSQVANAFIVGLLPSLRYVFFTETLYRGLTESELECVMAHEMTHALRKHLAAYLAFSIAALMLLLFLHDAIPSSGFGSVALSLGSAFVFWVGVFGFVSRRFETEADLVGMTLTSTETEADPMTRARRFAGALYRVAELNRAPPDAGSWRHFSIARRGVLLMTSEARPEFARRFLRTCRALRAACLAALLLSSVYGAFLVREQWSRTPQARADWERIEKALRGWELARENRPSEAIPLLEESANHPAARGELWLVLAEAYEQTGRAEEAAAARKQAVARGVADPRFRLTVE